ncbi:heterokaryon incompatibility protein-domain-containing protein [Bisporella sp. PMI_857]|nr:heterokaryon incompatibility protein-domain-containing protein [Bisporella sp. PMI_857]
MVNGHKSRLEPVLHIRLLDIKTIKLIEFSGTNVPPYAILSHTWGCEEVSFREMDEGRFDITAREENSKIRRCCEEAAKDGYGYAWIDSCCIDKRSSAELSEAINSMFKWYSNAAVCYAYLSDLGRYGDLDNAQWFSRGWTLQELIAPKQMRFFDQNWRFIGTRATLALQLENITGVSKEVLADSRELSSNALAGTSISSKMSWASHRVTTREEDMAYCLMGLFNVNMPILYGEGLKAAFKRLQLEIIKVSPDQSIFAWRAKVPDS